MPMTLVDHHSKVGPHIADAEALITFTPMMTPKILEQAPNLKWIQTLGTGVDNLIDQPTLRKDVIVTNVRGIHGPPVSEAALASMLALARNLPGAVRGQDAHEWRRWPAQLLAQQDGRHFRRRADRRGAGADMQGIRHDGGRRQLGAAAGRRLRPHAQPRRAFAGGRRFRFLRAADAADANQPATASTPKCSRR